MSELETISTNNWQVSIPADWQEVETDSGGLKFESLDGTKGFYIYTLDMGPNEGRSMSEIANHFRAIEQSSFENMDGYMWSVVSHQELQLESALISTVDNFDTGNSYRIFCKLMVSLPIVVRASFHDYSCESHEESEEYFREIISSLQLAPAT